MKDATLFNLLARAAASAGESPALIAGNRTVSFSRLHENILALACRLLEKLERPGAVAILTGDGQDLLEAFFACAAISRPAMPLDPASPAGVVSDLFARYPIAALIGVEELAARLDLDDVHLVDPHCALPSGFTSRLPNGPSTAEFYWGLTSGTTGDPKLFARSHASWIASFEAAEAIFSFPPESRILIPGPLHHSLFLYGAVHALCRGHAVLLPGAQFRASRLAGAAATATHLYAVPFMLAEMVKAELPAPRLRTIFSGGAKLSAELRRLCETRWPADLVEFYGASETSFVTYHSTKTLAEEGSVGRPFPSVRLEIRDEDGGAALTGRQGQIFIASPMLFARYVGEPPAQTWFSAGDTGFFDDQGCLHLTGRVNRIINSKALKIRPEAVEGALMELPEVRRAAVVDMPDQARGAIAVAAIEFEDGAHVARNDLSAHCRARLGPRCCPRLYFTAERLPVTRSGKLAVAEIKAALLAKDPAFRELR